MDERKEKSYEERSSRRYDDEGGGGGGGGYGKKKRRYKRFSDRRRCRFCREKMGKIDYKDVATLKKLCTSQGKLYSRKRSGNCSYHQRSAKTAIKRARFIALMPYMGAI